MAWNVYPKSIRNATINKLKNNHKCATTQNKPSDANLPKIWIRLPYLGTQGTTLINNCIRKLRKYLSKPVQFVIIYDSKKIAFFTSNKDKIPPLFRFYTIYQITCPGCNESY